MSDLKSLTLAAARDKLKSREISAHELVLEHLSHIEKTEDLNAFITLTGEQALEAARESDERLQNGSAGLMEGLPIGMKDLFCTEGVRTTAASKILDDFISPYESTVSSNLKRAGAITLGKTNLDEFAMGSSNLTSAFGPVKNPWTRQGDKTPLVPGGSSGGSAAAVAAHQVMAATGTDTGGSVRQPAAFCGIVGLKPTYGRCSRYGVVAFASSLDHPGPMARTVQDTAIMLEAMAGYDSRDATSVNLPVPSYEAALTGDIRGLRVGIPTEYQIEGMDPALQKLWEQGAAWLKDAGAEIIDISLSHTKDALPAYYILAPAEASSNLARYDGMRYGIRAPGTTLDEIYKNTREQGFGKEVKKRILIGTYVLSAGYYDAYYIKAQRVRRLVSEDFQRAFNQVDVILSPSAPTGAFPVNEPPSDPLEMYMNDVFTVASNLAGIPAISVPAGFNGDGLPLGLQLISPAFTEEKLLNVASVVERAADFSSIAQNMRKAS